MLSVAAGIDDYYAGRGESPGVWVGRGAAELELDGVVGNGELGRLISGRHPLTSAELRKHPPKKQIMVERIDSANGERYLEEQTLKPVAGYDLVFSPPKSVSLLHALGTEDVRHAVNQAHLAAWQAALGYLEQRACVTRRGSSGFYAAKVAAIETRDRKEPIDCPACASSGRRARLSTASAVDNSSGCSAGPLRANSTSTKSGRSRCS